MKLALITPYVPIAPASGYELRLAQLHWCLQQASDQPLAIWEAAHKAGPPAAGGHEVLAGESTAQVQDWLEQQQPSHVILVHPYATALIPALRQQGRAVFVDCHNVESLLSRELLELEVSTERRRQQSARFQVLSYWEKHLFPLATEIWAPSDEDAACLLELSAGRSKVLRMPNTLDLRRYEPADGANTHDIVLPGSFNYGPNARAAEVLRDLVLPVVQRSIPDARLLLVGRDEHGHAGALSRLPDVIATGSVADTRPYLQRAAVVAVPVLQGSGTRFKILEALALARPVVTTPLGCAGLDVADGAELVIRPIEQFASAIIELLLDPERARLLGQRGRKLVEQEYTWENVAARVQDALAVTAGRNL